MRALVAFAIALLASPSLAHAAAPSGDVHELAKALVEIGGERPRMAKILEPIEAIIAGGISLDLSLTEPDETAKVKSVVHQALAPISDRAGDAMVDAYSANFTAKELSDVLTYMNTPAAKAEKANLPLLKADMGAALSGASNRTTIEADAIKVYDGAPPAKRELVLRILKAQDFEARNKRDLAIFGAALTAAVPADKEGEKAQSPSAAPTAADSRASDDYMRLMVAIQKRYYVDRFSEADLSTVAAYLESEAGQAVLTRLPLVRRVVGKAMADATLVALGSLDAKVCATVPCNGDQRSSIAEHTRAMASSMTSALGIVTK